MYLYRNTDIRFARFDVHEPSGLLADCLSDPVYERVLLYLPFERLEKLGRVEKKLYREAFLRLMGDVDFRETFVQGDIPEPHCRHGEPEKIVKVLHLVPWVLKSNIFTFDELFAEVKKFDHPLVTYSFLDGVTAAQELDIVDQTTLNAVSLYAKKFPPREPPCEVTELSPNRCKWLEGKKFEPARPAGVNSTARELLKYPYEHYLSNNYFVDRDAEETIDTQLSALLPKSNPTHYLLLVGGSLAKSYARAGSDLDYFIWDSKTEELLNEPPRPKEVLAHIYLNYMVFVQNYENKTLIKKFRAFLEKTYLSETSEETLRACVKRLELDLCCYRLLHKGFARVYPDSNPEYKCLASIDGQTPFYETDYRELATFLYLRRAYIPSI